MMYPQSIIQYLHRRGSQEMPRKIEHLNRKWSPWRKQGLWPSHRECKNVCVCLFIQSNPIDCSLPDSSVQGILQARILEWVAIPFSRGSSQPRDWTLSPWALCHQFCLSHPYLFLFLKFSLCLFMWLCQVLVVALGTFDLCRGMWTPSCSMWDLAPWQGIEWRALHWECGALTTGPPRKSLLSYFLPPFLSLWGQNME